MFLILVPAIVQSQPITSEKLHALSEALEGIPEALTDHRPDRSRAEARKALALWDREKSAVLAVLPAPDRTSIGSAMDQLRTSSGDAAGLLALNAMEILEHRLPEGRPRWLAAADRQGMQAWIFLGQKRTDIPDLFACFEQLINHDDGHHPGVVDRTHIQLKHLQSSLEAHNFSEAQVAVGRLLDLVDVFER